MILISAATAPAQNRQKTTINTGWKFYKGDTVNASAPGFNDQHWQRVNIPHTWNSEDHMDEVPGYYRGPGWYRKKLRIDPSMKDKRIFLYFEASNQVTKVYVNGEQVGQPHIGGYTSFSYDITPYLEPEGDNLLAVKVDNSHNKNIIPLEADFTFYGGIYRDVYLVATHPVHFEMNMGSNGIFIQTPRVDSNNALVSIRGSAYNETENEHELTISHEITAPSGKEVARYNTEMTFQPQAETEFSQHQLRITEPRLWSPENPHLYTVTTTLKDPSGKILDQVNNPLGLRWFRFDPDTGFHLNGKNYKLIGSNRHQDYPGHGFALKDHMHRYDMKKLKEMGINFLRVSHYPHDPDVLEMCDRYGFIAIEEIPFINEITLNEEFMENSKRMLREMIRRDYNHPSIVAWNTSNETSLRLAGKKDELSEEGYQTYVQQLKEDLAELDRVVKQEDTTRYSMTVHCCGLERNIKLGLHQADIIGYNQYWGWYFGEMDEVGGFFEDFRKQDPEHPFILSEYGAGADPRIHTYEPRRFDFSVEYQAKLHQVHYRAIKNNPHIVGSAIWNFADFMVEHRQDAMPHVNSKGITTLDRRPKNAYYFYKTVLSDEPYIVLPSKLWDKRSGRPDRQGARYSTQPVEAYANVEKGELFLNNESLGVKEFDKHTATWQVPFRDGNNLLEIRAQKNGKTIKDFLRIDFQMQPYHMKDSLFAFDEIAVNVGSHFYFIDEARNDYIWVPDKPYEEGSWGYVGGKMYLRDFEEQVGSSREIIGTDIDPIYQTQRYGLDEYRFDVPNGRYEVTLYFSELISGWFLEQYLEHTEKDIDAEDYQRVFSVEANGQPLLTKINLAEHYGANKAITRKWVVEVKDGEGLRLNFEGIKDVPVVNGIRLRKMHP